MKGAKKKKGLRIPVARPNDICPSSLYEVQHLPKIVYWQLDWMQLQSGNIVEQTKSAATEHVPLLANGCARQLAIAHSRATICSVSIDEAVRGAVVGGGTVSRSYSTSREVRCRDWITNLCVCCLLSTLALGLGGAGPAAAAADAPILDALASMRLQIEDLRDQLKKAGEDNQRLAGLIASLNIRLVHYRVDASGNLTTGEGAEFSGMNPAKPLVIQKSENVFCAISKTFSNVRGDNGQYTYLCEVARNTQNLWTVTAAHMSACRVTCVGMEIIGKDR